MGGQKPLETEDLCPIKWHNIVSRLEAHRGSCWVVAFEGTSEESAPCPVKLQHECSWVQTGFVW